MGLAISVEYEGGKKLSEVGDPQNILHRVLPENGDPGYRMLSYVDWYGDTVFNHLQIPIVIEELKQVSTKAQQPEEKQLLGELVCMAESCLAEPHRYLKFYGD